MKQPVFIIAEAGVNHNGDLGLAMKLVDAAADAGADAVKFQTFKAEQLVSKNTPKADYQKETTGTEESQLEMIQRLELAESDHHKLMAHCRQKGIQFLSTPFDMQSIDLLDQLELPVFKIPSGEITNLPYLRKIGGMAKKIILSTGMSTMEEVRSSLDILVAAGSEKGDITILHANTEYPTPYQDVNLNAMQTMASELGVNVGYSDHTPGIEIPVAAVALGATVIEKHFTLSRDMEGPDHKASLEPAELKAMVQSIRNIESAMGDGVKKPSPSEIHNMPIARKSIVAAKPIAEGEIYSAANLTAKRPGTGVSPMHWDKMVGQVANRAYEKDELIDA